jgi:hypothetical protein
MMRRLFFPVMLALIPLMAGCSQSESAAQDRGADKKKSRDEFAQDQIKDQPKMAAFDGQRALGYLRDICRLGPRISGSEGMQKQQELLKTHFEKHGAKVSLQRFEARQVSRKDPVPMANMIITWHPERERRILICGHYDTRPIADQEDARRDWTKPFISANDGASTAAWMMELAPHLKELDLSVGLDFVLFDGEEYIFEPGRDKYFFGSEFFASEYRKTPPKHRYVAGVLLDLFAGKNAKYPIEQNSAFSAGGVVESIWKTAAELGVTAFQNSRGIALEDDHLALNNAGIPTVDIVDFGYPHWHRLSDTPEMCSAESMEQMAKVLTVWARRVK